MVTRPAVGGESALKLFNSANQQVRHYLYTNDITMTGSAQLVMGQSQARSVLMLQNIGSHTMNIEFGSARAHCTLSSGAVNSVVIDNGGFGFTKPPVVVFLGGGPSEAGGGPNSSYLGLNQPNGAAPSNFAQGHAVLSGSTVASVTIDNPGSGYVKAPYVFLYNDDLDPYGCATPSSTSGIQLLAGGSLTFNGTGCPTDPISVIGTASDVLVCRWMD